jgi:hypothetical protein
MHSWLAIDEARRKEIHDSLYASSERVGAKPILFCKTTWVKEEYFNWGVTVYPSIEARIQHARELEELGLYQYLDVQSVLGTRRINPKEVDFPHPIYKLSLVKAEPYAIAAYGDLSVSERKSFHQKAEDCLTHSGGFHWLDCSCYWSDERYLKFTIDVFPSFSAEQEYMQAMEEMMWGKYFPSFSLLGIPYS